MAGNRLLGGMIKHGLRAQLRPANLLTGQLYVNLDVFPNAKPVTFNPSVPAIIPTVPGNLDQLQQQLSNIVNKIEKIPFDKIGEDLRTTLASTSRLMNRLDKQVAPEAQGMLKQARDSMARINELLASDGSLPVSTERALQELNARRVRCARWRTSCRPIQKRCCEVAAPIPFRALVRSRTEDHEHDAHAVLPRIATSALALAAALAGCASAPHHVRAGWHCICAGWRAGGASTTLPVSVPTPADQPQLNARRRQRLGAVFRALDRALADEVRGAVGRAAAQLGALDARGETRVQRGGVAGADRCSGSICRPARPSGRHLARPSRQPEGQRADLPHGGRRAGIGAGARRAAARLVRWRV